MGVNVLERLRFVQNELAIRECVCVFLTVLGSWRHNAVVEESCVQRVSDKLSIEFAATVSIGPTAAYAMLMDFVALKAGMRVGVRVR